MQCFLGISKQCTRVQIACLQGIPDSTALCGNLCDIHLCLVGLSTRKLNKKTSSLSINCVTVLLMTTLVVLATTAKLSPLLMKGNGECVEIDSLVLAKALSENSQKMFSTNSQRALHYLGLLEGVAICRLAHIL